MTEAQRNKQLVDRMVDQMIEFKPFLATETIKLSPRMVIRFFVKPTRSGQVCSIEQATKFVMLCKTRGLDPWQGDAYIVGYDTRDPNDDRNKIAEFNLITAHQAFLKRAEVHPEYDGIQAGVVVRKAFPDPTDPEGKRLIFKTVEVEGDLVEEGETLIGAWAKVHRKGRTHPMYKRLKLATFNKDISRWKIDPAGMIVKCAEGDALRSAFPNTLGGMYLEGEFDTSLTQDRAAPAPLPEGKVDLRRPKAPATTGPTVDQVLAATDAPAPEPVKEPAAAEREIGDEPDEDGAPLTEAERAALEKQDNDLYGGKSDGPHGERA